jgi:ferredoxin
VQVCPTNVFDAVPGAHPVIARQADCQTCFMCEAWCPADALFVAPLADPAPAGSPYLDEPALRAAGQLGAYRAWIGWGNGRRPGSLRDRNADLGDIARRHVPDAQVV